MKPKNQSPEQSEGDANLVGPRTVVQTPSPSGDDKNRTSIQSIITIAILSSFDITIGIGILLLTIFIIKPTNFFSIAVLIGFGVIIIGVGLFPVFEKQNGKNINN
jgi:hypothetical protein